MTILENGQELRTETNKLALGQFKVFFGNSKILNFILVSFKAQLHLILKKAHHFQFSCSIPFDHSDCLWKSQEKKKKGKKNRLD